VARYADGQCRPCLLIKKGGCPSYGFLRDGLFHKVLVKILEGLAQWCRTSRKEARRGAPGKERVLAHTLLRSFMRHHDIGCPTRRGFRRVGTTDRDGFSQRSEPHPPLKNFHNPPVTSNLVPPLQIGNHGRGSDGLLQSKRRSLSPSFQGL
jgi:hypothetical protein